MIELNQTLVFQIIGFFVLMTILNRFLYKPVQRILKERDERINGAMKKAQETAKDVEAGLLSYDKSVKEAAVKGNEERSKLRQAGLDIEKMILDKARTEAAAELAGIRKELERSKETALSELKTEAKGISAEIAGKVLERNVVAGLLLFILPLLPTIASASEAGGHGGSGSTWKIINFVILVVGIVIVWNKIIKKALNKRGSDIQAQINEANAAKEAAERKAEEYRQKFSSLQSRINEIHNELRLEGEAEKKRIEEEAQKASVKLKEQAKLAAEQEIKKARLEIREEVAELSVKLAQELLKKELKPEDQERLVKGYLNNLRLN